MKRWIIMTGVPAILILLCFGALLLILDFKKVSEEDLPIAFKGRFRALGGYISTNPDKILWGQTSLSKPESEVALEQAWREMSLLHILPQEIAQRLESQFPLRERLKHAGEELAVIAGRIPGEWYSLKALQLSEYDEETNRLLPISNFTIYPNELYLQLKTLSDNFQKAPDTENSIKIQKELVASLLQGYLPLAGTPYRSSLNKTLRYPSFLQLKAEAFYYKYPLLLLSILLYAASVCLGIIWALKKSKKIQTATFAALWIALGVHTIIIALRCFILARPPVSNMFETVLYVSWIVVVAGILLHTYYRLPWLIIGASAASGVLLTILEVTQLNSSLDNVQAVLDSRYWLIIHVLMVVGSYGFFVLSGILGHFYLIGFSYLGKESERLKHLAKAILQCMYIGTALLICGTILGGVWAAESWGRFWDWDPKEAWAFISSCAYLMGIHAYRFQHIGNFGLAVTAIVGLQAISFTWYGVNYILGTGLHSYGFGSGGEIYYYLFILSELLFLMFIGIRRKKSINLACKK